MEAKLLALTSKSRSLKMVLKAKEEQFQSLREYEAARVILSRSGFRRIDKEAKSSLLTNKKLINRINTLLSYLEEKMAIDTEYSNRLHNSSVHFEPKQTASTSDSDHTKSADSTIRKQTTKNPIDYLEKKTDQVLNFLFGANNESSSSSLLSPTTSAPPPPPPVLPPNDVEDPWLTDRLGLLIDNITVSNENTRSVA